MTHYYFSKVCWLRFWNQRELNPNLGVTVLASSLCRVNTSEAQSLIWNHCCCQTVSLEISAHGGPPPALPGFSLLTGRLTWCQDMVVVISSFWHPPRHPYFIRSLLVDLLRFLFKPEWSSFSQLSLFQWVLNPSSWAGPILGSPEPLWVGPWGNLCSYLRPFGPEFPYHHLYSGVLCAKLGAGNTLWGSLAPWPTPAKPLPSQLSNPIWRLQRYQPSSCSDTQSSSNTIVSSCMSLLSPLPVANFI